MISLLSEVKSLVASTHHSLPPWSRSHTLVSCISSVTEIIAKSLYFIPHYIHICFDWNVLKCCQENMMNKKRESHGFLTSLAEETNVFVTCDCFCKPCWTKEGWRCPAGAGAVTSYPCLGVSRAQMCYLWSCGCCLKSLVFLKNVFGDAANTVDFIQRWWLRTHFLVVCKWEMYVGTIICSVS